MNRTTPRDHYAEITTKIVAALEAGTPPWRCGWDRDKAAAPTLPRNAITAAAYRGINVLTLGMSMLLLGSNDPRWVTYKQAASQGWQVRKGEHGTTGIFYKRITIEDQTEGGEDERTIPMLKAFTLFHASQVDGIPEYEAPDLETVPWRTPDAVETIMRNTGATIRIGGPKAFYSPSTDHIQMPPPGAFRSAESWSSVLLHEASHWTGHETRMKRNFSGQFGTPSYAQEELRAEMAQMILCAELGIADCEFTNGTAYLAHWLKSLKNDKKEIFRAAAEAQRIADYLLRFHPAYAASLQSTETGSEQAA